MSSILSSLLGGQASPAPAPEPQGPQSDNEWESFIRKMVADGVAALHAGAPDDQEAATVHQCITALQKILGQRQSQAESALGVTPAHKALGRAY